MYNIMSDVTPASQLHIFLPLGSAVPEVVGGGDVSTCSFPYVLFEKPHHIPYTFLSTPDLSSKKKEGQVSEKQEKRRGKKWWR